MEHMALIATHEHFYATPAQKMKACPLAARISQESPQPRKPAAARTSWGDPSISSTRTCDAGSVGPEMFVTSCKTELKSNLLARKT